MVCMKRCNKCQSVVTTKNKIRFNKLGDTNERADVLLKYKNKVDDIINKNNKQDLLKIDA